MIKHLLIVLTFTSLLIYCLEQLVRSQFNPGWIGSALMFWFKTSEDIYKDASATFPPIHTKNWRWQEDQAAKSILSTIEADEDIADYSTSTTVNFHPAIMFKGKILEVGGYLSDYKNAVTYADGRVESYLALKYGITMNEGSARDYVASDGTVVYNGGTAFSHNIAGIGRDISYTLHQKQAQSQNRGIQPVIGLGELKNTNIRNTGSLVDKQFLVWGSDINDAVFNQHMSDDSNKYLRMHRIWKVQQTGPAFIVTVALPSVAIYSGLNPFMIVAPSPDIHVYGPHLKVPFTGYTTINGELYLILTYRFSNNEYFSFAVQAPSSAE